MISRASCKRARGFLENEYNCEALPNSSSISGFIFSKAVGLKGDVAALSAYIIRNTFSLEKPAAFSFEFFDLI